VKKFCIRENTDDDRLDCPESGTSDDVETLNDEGTLVSDPLSSSNALAMM